MFTAAECASKWCTGALPARSWMACRSAAPGTLTRPLCSYPNVAGYVGTGSTSDAANFRCVSPEGGDKDDDD